MDCHTLLHTFSDYIDGQLDDDQTQAAEEHLATCHNCSVMLDSTQKARILYRQQAKPTLSEARRENLLSQIEAALTRNQ